MHVAKRHVQSVSVYAANVSVLAGQFAKRKNINNISAYAKRNVNVPASRSVKRKNISNTNVYVKLVQNANIDHADVNVLANHVARKRNVLKRHVHVASINAVVQNIMKK